MRARLLFKQKHVSCVYSMVNEKKINNINKKRKKKIAENNNNNNNRTATTCYFYTQHFFLKWLSVMMIWTALMDAKKIDCVIYEFGIMCGGTSHSKKLRE